MEGKCHCFILSFYLTFILSLSCIYVSGVPGTGKTATVLEAIKLLTDESKRQRKTKGNPVRPFTFIEVNGLRFTDPYQVYSEIYQCLSGRRVSSKAAADALDNYFSKPSDDKFIVLLVDELDLLCTKKQTILYHLFDWPNKPMSNLVVVAIANAMDLPERVLISRVASRLGLTRLTFQPYTHQELQEIIQSRLEGTKVFDSGAIQLVARKVAAVSGDARRALDICRQAVAVSERRNSSSIEVSDVHNALNDIFSSMKIVAIRESSTQEQIFLQAIVCEFKTCGLEEAIFSEVIRHHQDICRIERHPSPTTTQLMEIAFTLYDRRLILLDPSTCFLKTKIRLNVSTDDIDFALKSEV